MPEPESGRSAGPAAGGASEAGRHREALHRRTVVAVPIPIAERESRPVSTWYATEGFTDDERTILATHFTSLESPVFALIGLPEAVKGALFARYSRSTKSLRRLFLDEFADDVLRLGTAEARGRSERAAG